MYNSNKSIGKSHFTIDCKPVKRLLGKQDFHFPLGRKLINRF